MERENPMGFIDDNEREDEDGPGEKLSRDFSERCKTITMLMRHKNESEKTKESENMLDNVRGTSR
jgi:hypothetical protein